MNGQNLGEKYHPQWDFPGGLVIKTLHFKAGVVGSIPGQGAKILNALGSKTQKHKAEAIL